MEPLEQALRDSRLLGFSVFIYELLIWGLAEFMLYQISLRPSPISQPGPLPTNLIPKPA